MSVKNQEVYSEVYSVLNMLGENFIQKIPREIYAIICNSKSKIYNPSYNPEVGLEKQKISREAISMIALLHMHFWCDMKSEQKVLKNIFETNEKKYQEKIQKECDIANFIKKDDIETDKNKTKQKELIVSNKPNYIKKFFDKLKEIFKL